VRSNAIERSRLLAGPKAARYTTLVSKHSESSDATNSRRTVGRTTEAGMTQEARLVLRERRPQGTRVELAPGLSLGGRAFVVMAGPCAVEDEAQIAEAAAAVADAGCAILRGGAFKPRSSPYSFQGLGAPGVRLLLDAAARRGLGVVTEVLEAGDLPAMEGVALLQVGARNMQNFALLKALSRLRRPVLLKRGMSATVEEWLLAAEYLLAGGNEQVILCERGIRTFETATRNTLDLAAVVLAKQRTHLPVIVDPSHATGRRELVIPLSLAAAAAGADGLLVEVHPRPSRALSDGAQALPPADLRELMRRLPGVLQAVDRELWRPAERTRAVAR
jgi:3-deoxy-7-phosphoheptulonate synthase